MGSHRGTRRALPLQRMIASSVEQGVGQSVLLEVLAAGAIPVLGAIVGTLYSAWENPGRRLMEVSQQLEASHLHGEYPPQSLDRELSIELRYRAAKSLVAAKVPWSRVALTVSYGFVVLVGVYGGHFAGANFSQ